jgi:hypothetical protein
MFVLRRLQYAFAQLYYFLHLFTLSTQVRKILLPEETCRDFNQFQGPPGCIPGNPPGYAPKSACNLWSNVPPGVQLSWFRDTRERVVSARERVVSADAMDGSDSDSNESVG